MAISDDWTVDFTTAYRRRIYHSSGTTVYSMNELYSWLMNVFDESGTIDDTIPMTAQTPTAYTLTNGWFLDYVNNSSHQFLEGGSLKTIGWDAGTYSYGIRKKAYDASGAGTPFGGGDIGLTITETDSGDTGIILAYDTSLGAEAGYVWIRPTGLTDTFQDVDSAYTVATSSAAGAFTAASTTGENVWANPFTLGTIENQTEIYLVQNSSALTSWWVTGHIDILALVKEAGTEIDTGLITFFARQYSTLYDHYLADLSDGARTPIPLATNPDTNNTTGYWTVVISGGSSALFNEGNYAYVGASWAAATAKAVITNVNASTLTYYLVGNLTNISNGNTVTEYVPATGANGDGAGTAGIPAAAGPTTSPASTITATFGGTNQDLSNGNGSRPYSVIIDCQQTPIEDVYERLKYITRRGYTTDIDAGSQTIAGQSYVGIGDYYLPYDTGSQDNPFTEGETITATGSFSCTLTSKHDQGASEGFLIVRNVRGTIPVDNTTLTGVSSGHTALIDTNAGADPVAAITQVKQSPFGTFAGGKFFGARGVFLTDYLTTDATAFELIDSEGVPQTPPNVVPIEVTGVARYAQCYVVDSVPNTYLNAEADTAVTGNSYKALTSLTYTTDIPVTIRAREMGFLPFETTGTISSSGLSITAVWLVDPNWKFVVTGVNITFNENGGSPDTIVRASGDFATDGWIGTMSQVTVEGSTSNDGTYEIGTILTDTITLAVAEDLTAEGPSSGITLTFTRRSLT